MATVKQLERQLSAAGAKRQRSLAIAEQEMQRIASLAREAVAAGIPITKIEDLTGVTRPTLYKFLRGG